MTGKTDPTGSEQAAEEPYFLDDAGDVWTAGGKKCRPLEILLVLKKLRDDTAKVEKIRSNVYDILQSESRESQRTRAQTLYFLVGKIRIPNNLINRFAIC